jgi:hypothetical protein
MWTFLNNCSILHMQKLFEPYVKNRQMTLQMLHQNQQQQGINDPCLFYIHGCFSLPRFLGQLKFLLRVRICSYTPKLTLQIPYNE